MPESSHFPSEKNVDPNKNYKEEPLISSSNVEECLQSDRIRHLNLKRKSETFQNLSGSETMKKNTSGIDNYCCSHNSWYNFCGYQPSASGFNIRACNYNSKGAAVRKDDGEVLLKDDNGTIALNQNVLQPIRMDPL